MTYFLESLRETIAQEVASILEVDSPRVHVDNAHEKFDADLAVPVFQFAKEKQQTPAELADSIASTLPGFEGALLKSAGVAGFVNIWLNPAWVAQQLMQTESWETYGNNNHYADQEVLVEHTDPNPFKELHIGHVYSSTIGESLARLHEASGAAVHRVSYHGDVGLHIAKAMWAIGREIDWDPGNLQTITQPIGSYYAKGNEAYESDDSAKSEIRELNTKIYTKSDEHVNAIYDFGRKASFAAFEEEYQRLNVSYEKQFFERDTAEPGKQLVKDNIGAIFEESDGAVVYRGEQDGLHTRVFINKEDIPTYEAKDLGLMLAKNTAFPSVSRSIIVTANEIDEYFKVVLAAMSRIDPELAAKTRHISHGLVRLADGKMSSRTGTVIRSSELLDEVENALKQRAPDAPAIRENMLAAIKYAFLKPKIGGDITFDPAESINLEGQTGPYIQYAAVRAKSIVSKVESGSDTGEYGWKPEHTILMQLARYPETIAEATENLQPHSVAQYVYDLARVLNRYYEHVSVKDGTENEKAARIQMLKACIAVLTHGLSLLGIQTPAKM